MSEKIIKKSIVMHTKCLCDLLHKFADFGEFIEFVQSFDGCIINYLDNKNTVIINEDDTDINMETKLAMARCAFFIASFVRDNMDVLQELIRILDYKVVDDDKTIGGVSIFEKVEKKELSQEEYRQL